MGNVGYYCIFFYRKQSIFVISLLNIQYVQCLAVDFMSHKTHFVRFVYMNDVQESRVQRRHVPNLQHTDLYLTSTTAPG